MRNNLRVLSLRRRHAYVLRDRFFNHLKRLHFVKITDFYKLYQKYWAPVLNKISYRLFGKPSALVLVNKYFYFSSFFPKKKSTFVLNPKISYLFRSIFKAYSLEEKRLSLLGAKTNIVSFSDKASLLLFTSSIFLLKKKVILKKKNLRTLSSSVPVIKKKFLSSIKKKVFLLLSNTVSSLRLHKLFNLFSFKGNKNNLYTLFCTAVYKQRFLLYRLCFLRFFFKSLLLGDSTALFTQNSDFGLDQQKNSYFIRRLLGFNFYFTYLYGRSAFLKQKTIFLNPFFKTIFLNSSVRYLPNFFKSFYLFTELKSLKKSGRSFVVPVPIRSQNRRKFLFYHWLKSSVLARYEFSFSDRLTGELSDINSRRGSTINKLHFLSKSIKTNRVLIRKSRLSLL